MRTTLESLVEALETCPAKAVRALDVLPAPERHRVLCEWNDTEVAYPSEKCVHQLFEEQVCKSPDAVAVVFEDDALSYAELNRRANRLANHLRGLGVMPDSRVAICVERGFEMIVALLAVLKAGGAYVPLDPAYPLERLRFMLKDSAPVALLTQAHLQEMFTDIGDRLPVLDLNNAEAPWQDLRSDNADPHAIGLGPGHLAYVIYTSGSTGKPKGVSIEHKNVVNFIAWAKSSFTADILKRTLFSTSLNFDLAVYECFVPLISGATVRIVPNALYLARTQVDVTLINTVPSAINTLIEMHGVPETVLMVNLAGEPLRNTLVQRIFTSTHVETVCNLYGPSETTTYSTWAAVKRGEPFSSQIGRPIANTRIYILDAHGEPVPVGVAGELYIGGAGVARGYLNRPELTAEKFLADPFSSDTHARMYRTGDLGRYFPDGNIEFLGRNDFQVKLRGFRIELGEIETRLAEHAQVREAVVIAREDTPGDKRLVAYYTPLTEDAAPVGELLRAHLAAALPEYMVPAAYVRLKALPLTPNGKLDRKALPAPEADAYSSRGYEAPQGKTEIQLARIWAEVLRLDRVGRHDDFFNLGGHSLLAVKMITKVRECFGDSLPLATLFQTSTLEGLARVLELESARVPLPTIIPIRSSGAKPALFCVSRPNVNALGFIFLARRLAADQPVFGLQTHMREDGSFWTYNQQDYEAKAAEYISAMREVQPNGPYLLTGFCEGAHIAFEMARQLEACNLPVAMIAILDAWPIENTVSRWRFKLRGYLRGLQRWASMDRKQRAQLLKTRLHSTSSPDLGSDSLEERIGLAGAEFRTMRNEQMKKRYWPGRDFTPPTYGGRLTLFRTKKQDFSRIRDYQMGWGARSLGGVDVIPIPGAHALILREPYVIDLARKMDRCIERALENTQETSPSDSDAYPAVPVTA
jgi:amino acid adenylation domain-containing protein